MSLRFERIGPSNPCFAWDGAVVAQSLEASVALIGRRPDGAPGDDIAGRRPELPLAVGDRVPPASPVDVTSYEGAGDGWEGAFAGIAVAGPRDGDDGEIVLVRDSLGLNKLFWAPAGDGIELAARPSLLTDRGHDLAACAAVPPNTVVTYHPGTAEPIVRPAAPSADDPGAAGETSIAARRTPTAAIESGSMSARATASAVDPGLATSATARSIDAPISGDVRRVGETAPVSNESVEKIARRIREETARYVGAVLAARPGPAVVCLSGGLDSTSVAALVREHRDDVVAVSFDLARPGSRHRSDDFDAATAVAGHLGLTLVPAIHEPAALLDLLDTVLVAGIDWRDFNVHAGLVNAGLARSIGEIMDGRPEDVTVFTGDLVNELVADYHDETYRGRTYYRLPRLSPTATRAALVRGLATSHREIGVFGAFGLPVVQPYAVARRDFLRLPPRVLDPDGGKQDLYRLMFGSELPASSYHRPKTRAQIGSTASDAGVLGVCVDARIDAPWLERRFAELHNVTDPRDLRRFLRAGRYRTAIPRGTP